MVTPSSCAWTAPAVTRSSARPSTTRPARPTTRWPATSASATRAVRRWTGPRQSGDPDAFAFPRALLAEGYDFSFSGLKTSVVRTVERHPDAATEDVAASFQQAVADVLVAKARRAVADVGASGLCLAGGVAANSLLRRAATEACAADGVAAYLPSLAMCTDNAAMVAAAGWWRLSTDGPSPLSLGAVPNLALPDLR